MVELPVGEVACEVEVAEVVDVDIGPPPGVVVVVEPEEALVDVVELDPETCGVVVVVLDVLDVVVVGAVTGRLVDVDVDVGGTTVDEEIPGIGVITGSYPAGIVTFGVDGNSRCSASKPTKRATINRVERLIGNRRCTGRPMIPAKPIRLVPARVGFDGADFERSGLDGSVGAEDSGMSLSSVTAPSWRRCCRSKAS